MGNYSPDQLNALERLVNYTNTAEGSILPPQLVGGIRIPSVTNLQVIKSTPAVGGTLFTLTWTDVADGRNLVDHYDVSALGFLNNNAQPMSLSHSYGSPANVTVQADRLTPVIFVVQTVLKNGMVSNLTQSPSTSGVCAAPLITNQFIGQNQITGFNFANANYSNLVDNPSFELGNTASWRAVGHGLGQSPIDKPSVPDSGWTIVNDSANALTGTWYAKHTPSTYSANDDLVTIGQIQCTPTDQFSLSVWSKGAGGANGTLYIAMQFYNSAGNQISNSLATGAATVGYTQTIFSSVSGGGGGTGAAVQARIIIGLSNHTTGTWYIDDVSCKPILTGDAISFGPKTDITAVNGANNDVNIGNATFIRITGPTAAYNITGFQNGYDGRSLILFNTVAQTLTLKHQNAGSTANNRLFIPGNADVALRVTATSAATFIYSPVAGEGWVLIAIN